MSFIVFVIQTTDREEESRVHPLKAALCTRDPSLHSVPFWMTIT